MYGRTSRIIVIFTTFDVDGGSDVEAQTVNYGGKATKPETDPEKDGYTFKGWYVGETEYDWDTVLTDDVTIKAVYEVYLPQSYEYVIEDKTIEFALNGENNYQVVVDGIIPADVTLRKGDTVKITIKGLLDTSITNLSAFIVDNTSDASWWKRLSGYGTFAESITKGTNFENAATFTIETKQIGTGTAAHKIALYYDLSVNAVATLYPQGTNLNAGPVAKDLITAPQEKAGGLNITTLESIEALITSGYNTMTVTMKNISGADRNGWGILSPIASDAEDPWAWHTLKSVETDIGTLGEYKQLSGLTFDETTNEASYVWTLENLVKFMKAAYGSCEKKHQLTLQSDNGCIIESVIVSAVSE